MTFPQGAQAPQQPGAMPAQAPAQPAAPVFALPATQVFQGDPGVQYPAQQAHQLAAQQQQMPGMPGAQQQWQPPLSQPAQQQPVQQQHFVGNQPFQQQPAQPQAAQQQVQLPATQYASPSMVVPPNAGFPPELVGRPLAEAARMVMTMRQAIQQQFQPPTQQPRPMVPQQGQPQQQGQGQPVTMEGIQQAIAAAVDQATYPQAVQRASQSVANLPHVNDQRVQAAMYNTLANMNPQALSDAAVWHGAYKMALGELASQGVFLAPQQQVVQQQPAQMVPAQQQFAQPGFQQLNAGQQWQPAQPTGQFFTEQPNGAQQHSGVPQATQQDAFFAQKFGMPLQAYTAWKNGSVPNA